MAQFQAQEPKYKRLLDTIRSEIQRGIYQVHDQIPSEKELGERFDVSRVTVRRALKELTEEGLLERYQGKGTYVSMPRIQRDLRSVTSFHASCTMMGLKGSARVILRQLIAPTERDLRELQLSGDAHVIEVRRLCLADDAPVMLEMEETIFDQKGKPLHTSCQHIRADRFTFRI